MAQNKRPTAPHTCADLLRIDETLLPLSQARRSIGCRCLRQGERTSRCFCPAEVEPVGTVHAVITGSTKTGIGPPIRWLAVVTSEVTPALST